MIFFTKCEKKAHEHLLVLKDWENSNAKDLQYSIQSADQAGDPPTSS